MLKRTTMLVLAYIRFANVTADNAAYTEHMWGDFNDAALQGPTSTSYHFWSEEYHLFWRDDRYVHIIRPGSVYRPGLTTRIYKTSQHVAFRSLTSFRTAANCVAVQVHQSSSDHRHTRAHTKSLAHCNPFTDVDVRVDIVRVLSFIFKLLQHVDILGAGEQLGDGDPRCSDEVRWSRCCPLQRLRTLA